MPWYGFIHPFTAVLTLILGIKTAQTSMSRVQDWDFPVRKIRNRTVLFALLVVFNMVIGFIFNVVLAGSGLDVALLGHLPLSIIAVVLAIGAALISFTRSRKPGEVSELMKFHGWIVAIALAAIMTMSFIGVLKLFEG